jgi:poly(3-hydroxyalkanoate) synthetase
LGFSVDDLTRYDVPAIIAYIKNITKSSQVILIGFSQGCGQLLCALSLYSNLNQSISLFIAIGPAVEAKQLENSLVATKKRAERDEDEPPVYSNTQIKKSIVSKIISIE